MLCRIPQCNSDSRHNQFKNGICTRCHDFLFDHAIHSGSVLKQWYKEDKVLYVKLLEDGRFMVRPYYGLSFYLPERVIDGMGLLRAADPGTYIDGVGCNVDNEYFWLYTPEMW